MLPCHYNITHDSATSFTITNPETSSSMRFTFLWPNAKVSVMGGQQMAGTMSYVRYKAKATAGSVTSMKNEGKTKVLGPTGLLAGLGAFRDGVWPVSRDVHTAAQKVMEGPLPLRAVK